jgi:hypothetical protein
VQENTLKQKIDATASGVHAAQQNCIQQTYAVQDKLGGQGR